ncbi:tubulin-folding cofactor B-like [Phymastichus coffea]|uniref:tubulin-folding cofactor B-like n=1 Tax=Phymastichus coffea TaxID=108790 RepID=UPI00273B3F94|nr:tubulin-folding cofactor B-like [Phymastichus coffea]
MDSLAINSSNFINIVITSALNEAYFVERRFKKDITIQEFKDKLELLVGCQSKAMKLEVYNKNDDVVCKLNENDRALGSYPIQDGMRIHVIGDSETTGDPSNVEKFELSEEEYSKRSDTVKAFLKEHKLGKYNEEETAKKENEKRLEQEREEHLAKSMKINDRCEVSVSGNPKRRATVRYVGHTDFKKGWWIGVEYDEPFGKNDGSVAGKRYFECPDKYGGFVRPNCVVIGDFPQEDFDLDEEF